MFSSMLQHEIQRIGFVLVFFVFVVWPKASRSHRETFFFLFQSTHTKCIAVKRVLCDFSVSDLSTLLMDALFQIAAEALDTACSISLVAAETLYTCSIWLQRRHYAQQVAFLVAAEVPYVVSVWLQRRQIYTTCSIPGFGGDMIPNV